MKIYKEMRLLVERVNVFVFLFRVLGGFYLGGRCIERWDVDLNYYVDFDYVVDIIRWGLNIIVGDNSIKLFVFIVKLV